MRSRTVSIAPTAPERILVEQPDAITRKTAVAPPPRMKRATAVSLYMRNVMGEAVADSLTLNDGKNMAELSGMRKPVVVEFMDRAMSAILEKTAGFDKDKEDGRSTPMPKDEDDAAEKNSDNDSEASEVYEPENSTEKLHMPTIDSIQSMRDTLMQGTNIAQLAGLLTTSTFSLKDKRIDTLIGTEVPIKSREILMVELVKAIDALWERFGMLLIQQCGSFEKAFEVLDGDKSGYVDRTEFSQAYVDINSKAEPQVVPAGSTGEEDKLGSLPASSPSSSPSNKRQSTVSRKETAKFSRRSQFGGAAARSTQKLDVAQMNRTILKADAEFLFDMLRTGERGLANSEDSDDDLTVSMRTIIMRLTGLGEKTMESFRERIIGKYSSLQSAFDEVARHKKQSELDYDDFAKLFCGLYLRADGEETVSSPKRRSKIVPAGNAIILSESFNQRRIMEAEADEKSLSERATRIFNGIDIDGSGLLTVNELQRALASFGPPTPFSTFRRRLLLQYGSYDTFYSQQPSGGWKSEEQLEAFAMELDLNITDARNFAEKLGLVNLDDISAGTNNRLELPADGYSIEEFAISVFLNKAEEQTIEDLIAKLGSMDRDKDIPFREFSERIVNVAQQSMAFSLFSAVGAARAKDKLMHAKEKMQEAKQKGSTKTTPRGRSHSIAIAPVALPVTCRLGEVKCVYEALQREHRRVTVNILLRALTNFSDVLALDRNSYQSGDHIVCRVRLSTDALKRCKELPFVAVVPERLDWKDLGVKSHWSLDGEKVTDIVQVCERVHEMPRAPNGAVLREACLKISVPFVLASEERYEVRLFSSNNGHDALKQVGRSVPFDLLMPRPQAPLVDQISLSASSGEASVVLHWSPPNGNFSESPIKNFIVLVEPLIFRHERVAEIEDLGGKEDDDEYDAEDDDDLGGSGMKEVTVWSPALKGFTKKLSYGIDGLQRGVQYRFGIQCVHAGPGQGGGDGRSDIRGAPSELCDVVTMPLYNVTEAPGQPQVTRRADGMVELVWAAPADEGLSDSNRICNYLIQYRQCSLEYLPRHRGSARGSMLGPESSDQESYGDDESEHSEDYSSDDEQGWVDIDEAQVFISQPRWADFVGWTVPCHIEHLLPIDGEHDNLPHEFRVCASNYAGNSAWSRSSVPLQLITNEDKGVHMPVIGLELVDVQHLGSQGQRGVHRSHCLLRWAAPASSDMPRYTVQVRDSTQVRGEGGWVSAKTYFQRVEGAGSVRSLIGGERRRSSAQTSHIIEAIVTGLERFPPFANLSLQVRATSQTGSSTAEVQCPGIDLEPPEPLQEAPQSIQVLMSALSPPIVELQWSDNVDRESDSEKKRSYVVQASRASLPPKGESLQADAKWSEWVTVMDVCFSEECESDTGGTVTCFARDLGGEGAYIFRVCVVGHDGRLSLPSPPTETPIEVSEKRIPTSSRRSTLPKQLMQQPEKIDITPKKPREVRIIRTERGWCELSWEQRIAMVGSDLPTDFQVEECQDTHSEEAAEPTWVPARAVYASLEDSKRLDHQSSFHVKAAVFFADDRPRDAVRWRVRVRTEESEWSAPTQWQEPPPPPLPPRPSAPKVLRTEHQYFALEWMAPEGDVAGSTVHYEMQIQGHHQRHGGYTGKYSDWVSVAVYTKRVLDPFGDDSEKSKPRGSVLQALVERRDVVEAARGSDAVCFRVRMACANGVTGQPSQGSNLAPIHLSLPAAPEPKGLDLVGMGRIVMESQVGTMVDAECVRLQWFLPTPEEDPEGFNDSSLPGLVYELEAKDAENGLWMPMQGALIELNHTTRMASALMALPPSMGHVQQTRIRVASSRGKGAPASYSEEALPITWGAPVELEDTPRIVRAEPSLFAVRYTLPQVAARPESCSVIALVEIKKRQQVRFVVMDDDDSKEGSEKKDDEGDNFGESDASSDESSSGHRYQRIGEFLVYSQLATSQHQGKSTGQDGPEPDSTGMQLQQSCLGVGCEGIILLNADSRMAVGDEVRISLCIRMAGVVSVLGNWSERSPAATVAEPAGPPKALPLLEYPTWSPVLPSGEEVEFPAKMLMGTRKKGETLAWTDAALKSADGKTRFRFEVVNGSLPEGLRLDPDSGLIRGTGHLLKNLSSFTVRAEAKTAWPARNGAVVEAGSAASVTLKTSLLDSSVHDAFNVLMQDSVVEELSLKDIGIADVLSTLSDVRVLPTCVQLRSVSEGDAGDSAIMLVDRLLNLPSDAIIVAGELDEEDFISRLFGDDALSDEDSEHEGAHMNAAHESISGSPQSPVSGSQCSGSDQDLSDGDGEGDAHGSNKSSRHSSGSEQSEAMVEYNRKSIVAELPSMMKKSGLVQSGLDGGDVSRSESRSSSSMSMSSNASRMMRRHSLATTSLSGIGKSPAAMSGGPGPPAGFKAQSRRVSLAVQATDIKLNKLSELARGMGIAGQPAPDSSSMRKADSKVQSRRGSAQSDYTVDSDESSEEEEIPARENDKVGLSGILPQDKGTVSIADSARSSSEGGSVSEEMAKQLNEISQTAATAATTRSSVDKNSNAEKLASKKMSHGGQTEKRSSSNRISTPNAPVAQHRNTSRHSEAGSRRTGLHSPDHGSDNGVKVMLSYPSLTPLWPAFTDVEFVPSIKCCSRLLSSRSSSKRSAALSDPGAIDVEEPTETLGPGLLRFQIRPPLPAKVVLDEKTGIISGSPLMEHVAGRQYMITARWEVSDQVAAHCAVAFAVVSAGLANLCNSAFLAQEPPAFRPTTSVVPSAAEANLPTANDREDAEQSADLHPETTHPVSNSEATSPPYQASSADGPDSNLPTNQKTAADAQSMAGNPVQDTALLKMPPAIPFIAGMDLQAFSASRKPGTSGSPWKSKLASQLPPTSASRKNLLPLGPPLRDREMLPVVTGPQPGELQGRAPLSARPRMRALYNTGPQSEAASIDDIEWPSTAGSVRTALGLSRQGKFGGRLFSGGSSVRSWSAKPAHGAFEDAARTTGMTQSSIASARSRLTSSEFSHELPGL